MIERQRVTGPWTSEEIELLRREAERGQGYASRVARKTGRTICAVRGKAHYLRRRHHPGAPPHVPVTNPVTRWTGGNVIRLRRMAEKGLTQRDAANAFGISVISVAHLCMKHDIHFRKKGIAHNQRWHPRAWSSYEVAELQEQISLGTSRQEIASLLGRSVGAVKSKVREMGLRRKPGPWSQREDLLLRAYASQGLSDREIGARLGRTKKAVCARKRDLAQIGLPVPPGQRPASFVKPWSETEIQTFRELFLRGESVSRIAMQIGRTSTAGYKMAQKMGLKRRPKR